MLHSKHVQRCVQMPSAGLLMISDLDDDEVIKLSSDYNAHANWTKKINVQGFLDKVFFKKIYVCDVYIPKNRLI